MCAGKNVVLPAATEHVNMSQLILTFKLQVLT